MSNVLPTSELRRLSTPELLERMGHLKPTSHPYHQLADELHRRRSFWPRLHSWIAIFLAILSLVISIWVAFKS